MQNLDMLKTKATKIYLHHPFMWRFEVFFDSIAGLLRSRKIEYHPIDPLDKIFRDLKEEERIAKKYGFAEMTVLGYEMTKGIPIEEFPDREFEKRYAARKRK